MYGRIEEASAFAALTSIGSLAVPSQTTNQRLLGVVRAALVAAEPTTPAQIWPFGLAVSVNFTS